MCVSWSVIGEHRSYFRSNHKVLRVFMPLIELGIVSEGNAETAANNIGAIRSSLPFTLGIARTEAQLSAICNVRAKAYEKHLPGAAHILTRPDKIDLSKDVVLLFAQDKSNGSIVGTARIQTNFSGPLAVSESFPIPNWLAKSPAAEVSRLAILPGYEHASIALNRLIVKGCYQYCLANQIQWTVITARRSLVRGYLYLGYKDLDSEKRFWPLKHVFGLDHRILYFNVTSGERDWFSIDHPEYAFMCKTFHPDIQVFASVSSAWNRPRFRENGQISDGIPPVV
jgi:hypothetical protein